MENRGSNEDPESLERCIHNTLSTLYPACQGTSSTLCRQVLRVAEHCYRGDALRCLFHFLLPAKQLLAKLQHDARALHSDWAFSGDSWPLCIREKVAVQLCHPDLQHLRPGDFYLLVSPSAVAGPRLLLCSVLPGSGGSTCSHVEQQEVAVATVAAPSSLFTMSWLDSVNRERERRGAPRLERCLLSLHTDVFRVPWEDLVYPQLAGRPTPPNKAEDKQMSAHATRGLHTATSGTETDQLQAATESEDSEGEYVELAELPRFSPQRGSLTQSISQQHRTRTGTHPGFCASFGPPPHASPTYSTSSLFTPAEPGGYSRMLQQQNESGNTRCGPGSTAKRPVCREEKDTSEAKKEEAQEVPEKLTEKESNGHDTVVEGKKKDKHDDLLSLRDRAEAPDKVTGEDEVEVEEEVCVTIRHHGQEGKTEEQMQRGNNREGKQKKGEETPVEKVPECSYYENYTLQKHSGGCCSEKSSEIEHVNVFYSEKKIPSTDLGTQRTDSYFGRAPQTHNTAFSSAKIAEQTHTGGSYCESVPEANSGECCLREKALPVLSHREGSWCELQRTTGRKSTSQVPSCAKHIRKGNTRINYCKSCSSREQESPEVCEGEQEALAAAETSPAISTPASTVPTTLAETAPAALVPTPTVQLVSAEASPAAPVAAPTVPTAPAETAPVSEPTVPTALAETAPVSEPTVRKAPAEAAPAAPVPASTVLTEPAPVPAPEEPAPAAVIPAEAPPVAPVPAQTVPTAQEEPSPAPPPAPTVPTAPAEPAPVPPPAPTVPTAPAEPAPAPPPTVLTAPAEPAPVPPPASTVPTAPAEPAPAPPPTVLTAPAEPAPVPPPAPTVPTAPAEPAPAPTIPTAPAEPAPAPTVPTAPAEPAPVPPPAPTVPTATVPTAPAEEAAATLTVLAAPAIVVSTPAASTASTPTPGAAAALGKEAEELNGEATPAEGAQQVPVSVTAADSPASPQLLRSSLSTQSVFYSVLIKSGAICLPGSRDRVGRALITVNSSSSVWSAPNCNSADVLRLLLHYSSTLRQEVRALGLVVLVDARGAASPPTHLIPALRCFQEDTQGSVHSVLLLVDQDTPLHTGTPATVQVEQFSSLGSLQRKVNLNQLPVEFGGSLNFSQSNWLSFRLRAEQLRAQCLNVIHLLQKAISILQTTPLPSAAQDAKLLLSRTKTVMCCILEDSRLVQLQQEGGASLSRLRTASASEEERAATASVSKLYDQVDELLHQLVTLSNRRTEELNFVVDFSSVEQGLAEVTLWLQDVGEPRMQQFNHPEDSLELLRQKQKDFKEFCTAGYERCRHGEELLRGLERWTGLSSAHLQEYEVKVHAFCARLQDFSQRLRTTGHSLERAVHLYAFLDKAYGWALEGMRHLAAITMEECTKPEKCQAAIGRLDAYSREHPPIADSLFQEMKVAAGELRGERGLRQWGFAWAKCQETSKVFDRKMEAAFKTRDSAHRRRSDSAVSRSSASIKKTLSGLWGGSGGDSCLLEDKEGSTPSSSTSSSSSSLLFSASSTTTPQHTPQHTPLLHRLFRSASVEEATVAITNTAADLPVASSRRQQLRKIQSFDVPSTPETRRCGPRALAEPPRRGNTGVFIRGLEVSSTESTERPPWSGTVPCKTSTPEQQPRGSKLRHVVEEMITTEREYVRSLHYVVRHYFPEMERRDLPQDLRGKRSVIFGNLEKLLDFHSQFFLKELEACWRHPLRVPHCFIRHQEQFSLYALYSKNKPKSDALLASHGTAFFRRKQVELGDKMDLSSYLLKPVQRMSKYALLLADLIKEVGSAQEAELAALLTATDMVKFQLRHGNDLLAMDAVRDCDVNLKEQGQLIRQDEFTVWTGRRRCERHVFLFEELVLFSKPKKMEGGLDVFIYKHSFKTADVGLTESSGDSGRCFEIWFRRRTSRKHTFVLQAATEHVKHAWTSDIARILWTQATRNKELRLREMVSMGVGNKPFLDIQPSDAAISDRAVHGIMKSRGARTRASIAVSTFDHSNPFKPGAVTSDPAPSGLVSSGLLGPLNLHMYSRTLSASSAESSFNTSGIEEDEQEHETASQPSMTTESSDSSSRCLSGSTGSDSGCVSAHLQEASAEETGRHSRLLPSDRHLNSSQYVTAGAPAVRSPATVV